MDKTAFKYFIISNDYSAFRRFEITKLLILQYKYHVCTCKYIAQLNKPERK